MAREPEIKADLTLSDSTNKMINIQQTTPTNMNYNNRDFSSNEYTDSSDMLGGHSMVRSLSKTDSLRDLNAFFAKENLINKI